MAEALEPVNSIVFSAFQRQKWIMKTAMTFLLTLMALMSCAPVPLFHKEGASVSRMHDTLLSCRVSALEKAPVATTIRQTPPVYIPSRRYCNSRGHCYWDGGFFAGGRVYSVDENKGLRNELVVQCMAQDGYRLVEVQRCMAGTKTSYSSTGTDEMSAISERSCAFKGADDRWKIIEPAG